MCSLFVPAKSASEREIIKGHANPTKHSDGVLPPSITAAVVDDNISLSWLLPHIYGRFVRRGAYNTLIIIIVIYGRKKEKKPRRSPRCRTAAAMINIIHFFFNDRLPAGRIYVDNIIIFIIIITVRACASRFCRRMTQYNKWRLCAVVGNENFFIKMHIIVCI